jgi:hypothetical protein
MERLGEMAKHGNKKPIEWHKECLKNSMGYHKQERERIMRQLANLERDEALDCFRQCQIEKAIEQGKDSFDSEKFMADERKERRF